jgi:hypothetical protein
MRGKHRYLRALAHGNQRVGRDLAVSQDQHRRLQRDDARNAPSAVFGRGVGQVGDFALAQDLHAVGVDVVEVTHQVRARAGGADGHFVKPALRGAQARYPFPAKLRTMVFEQDVGADDGGFHERLRAAGRRLRRAGPDCHWRSCRAARWRRCWRSSFAQRRIAEQFGDLGQDFKVLLGGGFGHQQEDQQAHRLLVRGVETDGAGPAGTQRPSGPSAP